MPLLSQELTLFAELKKMQFFTASVALTRSINAKHKLNNTNADNISHIAFSFLVQLQDISFVQQESIFLW